MIAIIVAVILAYILQLAIWEGVVLGIAWAVGKIADISVNYPLIGGIVFGVWALILAIQLLATIGAYKEAKKLDEEFEERSRLNDERFEELRKQQRELFKR